MEKIRRFQKAENEDEDEEEGSVKCKEQKTWVREGLMSEVRWSKSDKLTLT